MIPTTADDLYSYYGDRRASLRSQLELPSPASDRTNIGSENDREVFSLPIANLVRRTDIPRGGLHHVSSVSVINDMLPDDDGMGKAAYLPSSASLSSYNDARDVIPADLSSPNVARFVAAPDTSTVIADTNGITNGMSGSHGIASTNGITDANGMASTNGMTDANAMANTNGITGENGISSYKVSSIDDKKQAAISQLPQVGVLEDVGAASVSGIESRQPLTEQESSRSPHSAKGVPDNVIQQALGVYPGYGSKVADANRHGDPAASNVAVAAYHQAPVSDVSMSNQPIKAPVSDISMSNQPIKSDDVDLDPTAQPQTAKLFPVESLAYTGLANSSKTVLSVTTKDSASSAVDGTRRVSTDPAEDNQSMESELMDPDHVAISKDKYHDFMKKVANLTTFANVLPAKHVASAVHDNHAYRDATMKTASASPSSVEVGPIGLSSDINPATTNPVNSLLAAVIKASSVGASKETSSLPLVSSSLSSLNPRIAPSMSTPLESVQTFSTGLPLPMKKPQQNEIDAPLQNSILPVGKTTSQPPVQVEPPVEQAITATESDAKQGVKPAAVVSVDLPFPARLVLPVPSQSPAQPLSGCSEALGISTSEIRNEQLSASSQLSPQFGPARARIGLQSDKQGNAGGWCSDPRQNDRPQYLQVDYKVDQDVCRIAIQGLDRARSWVSYYKLAFSSNGVHWSVYKEGGKEKVFQGNVDQDDFTSYRLIDPIKARFIRIVPQSWEGRSICLRTEMYNDNIVYNRGSKLYGRSSIPSALQGMIDHLTFEKLDDVVVFDSSSMGNNAFLNNGAAVYDTHGKCRHAARIGDGSDVLLDGRNMRVLPREAISISTWVRVDQTEGVHSIFDTVGAHSRHELGQYHFEIVGGAVRWFHRNENATQIFSAITEPNLINPKEWTHIVASYDSTTGEAKIYVNGSRVVDAKGQGLLSQDWAGRVGIGRHKDTRDLVGNIDEFRIYAEAIQGEKIMELARECVFDKYYCGSLLTAEQGILITPDYPALHKGPVKCVWEIKGLPGEVISLDIKELDLHDCNRSKFDVKDAANGSILASYCGNDSKPGHVSSHSNQMIIEFNSDGRGNGERFKVEFQREKVRATKKTMSSVCKNSDVYQNVTLVGGSKAGTFTDLGSVDDIKTCQEKCCEKETCEVSFMIAGNCYAVRCFDQEQCKLRKAKSSSLNPMISFISREGIPTRISPIFVDKSSSPVVVNSPKAQPIVAKSECKSSSVHYNSTLVKGMQSGNFTSRGSVEDFPRCLDLCCQSGNCDAAFLVKKTCFSVQCYSKESCNAKAARPSPFNPTLAYIIRDNGASKALADDIQGAAKSSVTKLSGVCAKSRISKIYQNITLKDGVKSGEFTDHGDVRSMNDCLKHCCSDDNCNLAFVIKTTCFTVKCRDYDSCSLKSAVSKYYNPRIAFVNWNPPRQNLGDGDVRYDYKGCWKDFDMSAFALPLLEGTDAALTGPYKRRQDPVNDCATVVQNRGYSVFAIQNGGACFSGANAETTYKRYGQSDACKGGRGGAFANSVYKLFEDGSVMSLGCWADLQDRAFRRLEKIDTDLQDSYINRANPIQICAKVARHHKANTFALQKGGQCFIGKGASPRYEKYGPSRKCKYGLGGQMANDVYFLKDLGNSVVVDKGDAVVLSQAAMPVKPAIRNLTLDDKPVPAPQTTIATTTTTTATTTTIPTTPTTKTTVAATTQATTQSTTLATTQTTPTTAATTPSTTPAVKTTLPVTASVNAILKSDSSNLGTGASSLQPGEVVYKEQLTDTEHIRYVYSAGEIMPNVTVASGIKAGTFTDKGAIERMEDCVRSCGETSDCNVAFKLGKQCFSVACFHKDTCATKPAFSAFYNPLVAFVKHRIVRTERQKEQPLTDINPTQRSLCKAKKNVANVTLVDGIGAGNFTDLGHVSHMDDCVSRCCSDSSCELAFKIEDDCYGVTCYSEKSCRTRSARNSMTLRPAIAYVRDVGSRKVFQTSTSFKDDSGPKLKPEKPSTCTADVWDGEIKENVTLVGGVNAGDFTDHGQTDSFNECMNFCCDSKECDLAFMIDNDCYGVKCKDPNNCRTRAARPTKYRPMIAFKKSTETGTTPGFSSTAMKSTFTATPTFGDPSSKHSCLAGPIIYNDTLRMGMHSGLFTKLGRVNKMDDCIERCCKSSNADVAFMLGPVCFAVKCYSAELCKTSPAMVSNIGDLNMNPTLSFLKKKEATMANGNAILAPGGTCTDSPITYNVTLKGGIHAGNFTNHGEGLTPRECVGKCCDQKSCDLAFMFADLCYSVKCRSDDDCQAVVAKPSNLSPKVSFVTRNRIPIDRETMFDAALDRPEDDTCEQENVEHSPIQVNRTLVGGLNAGNFSYLGKTKSMRECLGKCCSSKKCDVAYRIDRECFSVKCYSPDLCKVTDAPVKNGFVQFATMSRKDNLRRINTQSIAIYVIIGVLCFTVGITAIGWAMCMYMKRKNKKSQQQQTDDKPMPDQISDKPER